MAKHPERLVRTPSEQVVIIDSLQYVYLHGLAFTTSRGAAWRQQSQDRNSALSTFASGPIRGVGSAPSQCWDQWAQDSTSNLCGRCRQGAELAAGLLRFAAPDGAYDSTSSVSSSSGIGKSDSLTFVWRTAALQSMVGSSIGLSVATSMSDSSFFSSRRSARFACFSRLFCWRALPLSANHRCLISSHSPSLLETGSPGWPPLSPSAVPTPSFRCDSAATEV